MALREVRKIGDEILRKKSRAVDKIDDKLLTLIQDMVETMYQREGVGLAAPQVGVLKRVIVVDVGADEEKGMNLFKLVNPEIIYLEGSQTDVEGCLSIPNIHGKVTRPNKVTIKALDENGNEVTVTGEDYLARALCHEIDHLNGILFVDKMEKSDE